jgi:ABC-2 type transport system ATP-binding protein
VVMVDGRVVVDGTVADVIAGRRVVEVRCSDWSRAFQVLDAAGLVVQVHGDVLRVPGTRSSVEGLLARSDVRATVAMVPANLEEAFVVVASRDQPA